MTDNPSSKIIEMPITFVDWYHNDGSQEPDVNLTEAASLCYGWTVKIHQVPGISFYRW